MAQELSTLKRASPPPRAKALPRAKIPALARVLDRWRATFASLAAFGGVGAIAFVVDIGVYNLLRSTVLAGSPIWSKVVSVAVATIVAWVGNRTFAFRDSRRGNVVREAVLFALMNVGGLLIAASCLFVSHYLLGLTSQLADNISGNGVGLVLGTAFRYLGYRFIVFRPEPTSPASAALAAPVRTGPPVVEESGEPTHPGPFPLRIVSHTGQIATRTRATSRRGSRPHLDAAAPHHGTHIGEIR